MFVFPLEKLHVLRILRKKGGFSAHVTGLGAGNHFSVPAMCCSILVNTLSTFVSSWVVFQYNHMGSDANAATQKIIQVFSLVNNVSSAVCSPRGAAAPRFKASWSAARPVLAVCGTGAAQRLTVAVGFSSAVCCARSCNCARGVCERRSLCCAFRCSVPSTSPSCCPPWSCGRRTKYRRKGKCENFWGDFYGGNSHISLCRHTTSLIC